MLKKTMAILMSCAFLGTSVPAWAAVSAVSAPVRTVTRTEQSVTVECPVVTGGTKAATDKINSALSSKVASFVSEASTLGGGKVHYDVHRANDNVISLTLVMTPSTVKEVRSLRRHKLPKLNLSSSENFILFSEEAAADVVVIVGSAVAVKQLLVEFFRLGQIALAAQIIATLF